MSFIKCFVLCLSLIVVQPLYAYVGPGLSGGAVAAILGLVGSFFLAFFAVLYYPIKRLIQKIRSKKKKS